MPDIGDVVLDAAIAYSGVRPAAFRFAGTLAPGKLSDAPLNTILLSHRGGTTDQYRMDGAAIDVNPPWWLSAWQFIRAGAAHILEGFDHLLLVVCLVAADLRARAIALRITAFSVGHACSIASMADSRRGTAHRAVRARHRAADGRQAAARRRAGADLRRGPRARMRPRRRVARIAV
jgi:hypothetical protein